MNTRENEINMVHRETKQRIARSPKDFEGNNNEDLRQNKYARSILK